MRLDQLIVQKGLVPSRAKAQELIKTGNVEYFQCGVWKVADRASTELESEEIRLRDTSLLQYVSRGGLKLAAALDHIGFDVHECVVLDVGISTGGFSDCLLQRGAKRIVGIDVGSGQLAPSLAANARVTVFEGQNIRRALRDPSIAAAVRGVNFCVVDVSFIFLELVLPELSADLPPHRLLALIKPQFELSADALNKAGLVKDPKELDSARRRVQTSATASGYKVIEVFPSSIKGGDGNQEFFLWAQRCSDSEQVR